MATSVNVLGFINDTLNAMQYKSMTFLIIFLVVTSVLQAQHSVINPSFEGEPQDATVPQGWLICAPGSTPDILPGVWGVYNEVMDGDTYIGLITRPDGSYESIGQRLSAPLVAEKCYQTSIMLAHSSTYTGYNNPIKLRIWLGKTHCDRAQLILESDYIDSQDWVPHKVKFTAEGAYPYIILEAYHPRGKIMGNILLDQLGVIYDCDRT